MARTKATAIKNNMPVAKKPVASKSEGENQPPAGEKRKYKAKQGTTALRAIRREQKDTRFCIKKSPISRLIREISDDMSKEPLRFTDNAIEALRTGAEAFLIEGFNEGNALTCYQNHSTLSNTDLVLAMKLSKKLPNEYKPLNSLPVTKHKPTIDAGFASPAPLETAAETPAEVKAEPTDA